MPSPSEQLSRVRERARIVRGASSRPSDGGSDTAARIAALRGGHAIPGSDAARDAVPASRRTLLHRAARGDLARRP